MTTLWVKSDIIAYMHTILSTKLFTKQKENVADFACMLTESNRGNSFSHSYNLYKSSLLIAECISMRKICIYVYIYICMYVCNGCRGLPE